MKDPIVQKVRRTREKLAAACGFDLHRIALRQKQVADGWRGKKVTYDQLMATRRPMARVAESRVRYGGG